MTKHRFNPIQSANTFGRRVRLLRQYRNMRQWKLAEDAKISQSWLCDLENANDNRVPSDEMIEALASALGTSKAFLLMETDEPELHPEPA